MSFLISQELKCDANGYDTGSPSISRRQSAEAAAQLPDQEDGALTPSTPLASGGSQTIEATQKLLAETNEELRFLQERCLQFEVRLGHTVGCVRGMRTEYYVLEHSCPPELHVGPTWPQSRDEHTPWWYNRVCGRTQRKSTSSSGWWDGTVLCKHWIPAG